MQSSGQVKMSVQKCLDLIHFDMSKYNHADVQAIDTLIDEKNGYFAVKGYDQTLCQLTYFKNNDGSYLVMSTGYYSDMQCANYFTYFHSVPSSLDTAILMNQSNYMPAISFTDFFVGDSVSKILEQYIPQIRESYLNNGTLEDVINEVYDYHFILPQKGTKLKVELTICDYIPVNQVEFSETDWSIIETQIKVLSFSYDRKNQKFKKY
jgi:hypothetical protein